MFYDDLDEFKTTDMVPSPVGVGLAEFRVFQQRGTRLNTGVDRIIQSMRMILDTPIGARFFIPTFGSRIHSFIGEPNDFILADLLAVFVREDILKWEKRIDITDVIPVIKGEQISIKILFKLKNSTDIENFVYSINREIKEVT